MLLLVSASIILFSGVRSSRFDVRCLSDAVSPFILLQPATDGALGLPRHPTHSRFLLRGGFASSCANPPLRGRSRQCQILFVFLPFSEASSAALASFVRCSSMQLHRRVSVERPRSRSKYLVAFTRKTLTSVAQPWTTLASPRSALPLIVDLHTSSFIVCAELARRIIRR